MSESLALLSWNVAQAQFLYKDSLNKYQDPEYETKSTLLNIVNCAKDLQYKWGSQVFFLTTKLHNHNNKFLISIYLVVTHLLEPAAPAALS